MPLMRLIFSYLAIGYARGLVNALDQCGQCYGKLDRFWTYGDNNMSSFRDVTNAFSASPQIALQDVEIAAKEGFKGIICNRPDGEDAGQLNAEQVAKACAEHGLAFTHIPVVGAMSQTQIDLMANAIDASGGRVLAYCRSGTRSTNLWALSQAANGEDADGLVAAAAGAGYDLSGLAPTLRSLAAR
jgi:uncharacterized protein (TIGR01244 family)